MRPRSLRIRRTKTSCRSTDEIDGTEEAVDADDVVDSDEDESDDDDDDDDEDSRDGNALLIQEGDIAADYLERLLDIVDYDGDIDLDVENDRAIVAIVGSGLRSLVGPRGETLEALQELTRLAVAQKTGTRSRLMLDVSGHRQERRNDLDRSREGHRGARARRWRACSAHPDEPVRAQGRARRDLGDRRRAQRVRGRGAQP